MIIATDYNDPQLQAIRNAVSAKNDGIPFLLLPVKIETRFMRVDRPVEPEVDPFTDVLEGLFELEAALAFDPQRLPEKEVLGKVSKLAKQCKALNEQIGQLSKVSGKEKEQLLQKVGQIETAHKALSTKLARLPWKDPLQLTQLKSLRNDLAKQLQNTRTLVEKLSTSSGGFTFPGRSVLVKSLEAVNDNLQTIGEQDLSTSDRKEKRGLFVFLDEQLGAINEAIKTAEGELKVNAQIPDKELDRLESLQKNLSELYKQSIGKVRKIRSKYKRNEYLQQFARITRDITALHHHLDTRVKPRVRLQQALPATDARQLIWQIQSLRFQLKQRNQHPFKTFDQLKDTSRQVFDKLESIRPELYKVIEGSETERTALRKAWDETDKELEKYAQRVRNFKGAAGQKEAVRDIQQLLEDNFRHPFSGLKSDQKRTFIHLNNGLLEKSAFRLQSHLDSLRSIENALEEHKEKPTGKGLKKAIGDLVKFRDTFKSGSGEITILPNDALTDLSKRAAQVAGKVDKLVKAQEKSSTTVLSASLSKKARKAAGELRSMVKSRFAGMPERQFQLAAEAGGNFVFAAKTVTTDELWVRFYPDDIAIHTHEEGLTTDEIEAGKAYWYEIWAAAADYEAKLAAWRAISTAYGSQRAAWIVKTMEPQPEKAEAVQESLANASKATLQLNQQLQEVIDILSVRVAATELVKAVGTAYPVLQKAERTIRKITEEQVNLLLKTQKLIIRLQSVVGSIIKQFQSVPQAERLGTREEMEVVNQFITTFNRIIQYFPTISKLTSRDLIDRELPDPATPVFPEPPVKDGSWTTAPHSRVMPDRFVVLTMRGGVFRHMVAGKPLPDGRLTVGLDPATFDTEGFQYDADGNLLVTDSIKWLTDFNEAIEKGMAVSITLNEEDLARGFDKVLVLGVKDTPAAKGKQLLEELLENHHYIPEGASFLPIGTPTNNTEAGKSGYRTFEEDAALSFAIERNNEEAVSPATDPDFPTDSARLAEGLGISHDVLDNLDYHDRTEISEALTFNTALFYGTLGNHMEEGLDTLFTLDNINHTREFFCNYVSARGILPALRVGTQPYGILATTAFSKFQATANDSFLPPLTKEDFANPAVIAADLQTRYDIRLKTLLDKLNVLWTQIRENPANPAPWTGNTDPENPQAHFMKMLGLQANSTEIFYRYGLNVASRQAANEAGGFSISFDSNDAWSPAQVYSSFKDVVSTGYYYKSDHFTDEQTEIADPLDYINKKNTRISDQFTKARVFATRHLQDQSQILGQLIDNRELAEEVVAATAPNTGSPEERALAAAELQNFIDWLVNENPWDIQAENHYSELLEDGSLGAGMPSKTLLFLLLRHAVLSAYADAALKILEYEGLTDQLTRKKMGQPDHYYNRFGGSFSYVTKWTYLFSKLYRLNYVLGFEMDESNAFYNYMNSRSGSNAYLNRYLSPEHTFVFNGYANHHLHQPIIDELTKTKNAILKLKDIPTLRLQQLLVEHLDLCTYRLDAWRLGMVHKRLKKQRSASPGGIFLGAYGWVEDLRKGGERTLAQNLPGGLWKPGDEPVYRDADSLGFIHAPSLNHAITAAILRAGFHANEAIEEINNQMAINLSSQRVRSALNLLSGIRSGQDAAAILGYQFERGLHERYLHLSLELDQYIYDFRDEFPLVVPVDDSLTLGDVNLNNVVNGMELLETAQDFIESQGGPPNPGDSVYQSLKAFEAAWWAHIGNANISAASAAKRDAMLREIDLMADAFDALGDLCISESVYQVVRGNHVRASAIMDKLAKGDVPNDIEIADTPRTGTVVTQKVGLCLEPISGIDHALSATGPNSTPVSGTALNTAVSAAGARPSGWNSSFTPRALADPTLNKWAGNLIGDPSLIRCQVVYRIGESESTTSITLADLGLQPLDILHLFGTGPLDGGAELNARIAHRIKSTMALPVDFEGTADDAEIKIQYTATDNGWPAGSCSFYEKAAFIQSLRSLLTETAVLSADHLLIPGEEEVEANAVKNQEIDEYLVRITNLQARLQALENDWNNFFNTQVSVADAGGHTFTDSQIDQLRALLLRTSNFGIPGTIPDDQFSYGNTAGLILMGAAEGATKAITARLKQAGKLLLTALDAARPNDVRIGAVTEAGKQLLGKAFVMIPHFKLRNAAAISEQLALPRNKGLLRAHTTFAMEEWSQGLARVRERLATLDTVQLWAENFDRPFADKQVLQFPFALDESGTAADHWLGLEFPAGYQPAEDKLSVVLTDAGRLVTDPEAPKAALLVDEWVEIIPNRQESTGIAFQYDQPDAKAPNNLLLAVSPTETGRWDWDNLVYTMLDTLELAKNRAVEPEQLEDTVFGQILPAIFTEIVPPQLLPEGADDSGDAQDNPLGLQVVTDFGVVNETLEA